jgi:type I site-specific restriction endonuclease
MSVPAEVRELVEWFDRDLPSYRSATFNVAQARIDCINPLLGLLGWDVENRQCRPVAYRDVIYEDKVTISSHTKARDYGLYIDGVR